MPPHRKIPEELAPELVRLADIEQLTHEAIADWLRTDHGISAGEETVRRAIWRYKGIQEAQRPESESAPLEPSDPADALQSLRYQLATDAQTARKRMVRDESDADAGRLYLGLQRLRVSLLLALRDKGIVRGRGDGPRIPERQQPVQPVARFMVTGKPVLAS